LIAFRPDIYLHEIQKELLSELGIDASIPTIHRAIKSAGYTLKQVLQVRKQLNGMCAADFGWVHFIDKTSLFSSMKVHVIEGLPIAAAPGRSLVPGLSGMLILYGASALSLHGVLHVTVIQGAYTEAKFMNFIKGVLLEMSPFPGKNSVLVMDNAVIHKSPQLREIVEERYELGFYCSNLVA
ncbi:hypothetical protein M407DRAFT_79073, partial [Tulasnella calospora MUT 4182]